MAPEAYKKGMIWDSQNKCLSFCHEQYQADEEKSDTQKTQEVFKQIMNDVSKDLKFTTETQHDYTDGQLPTLDFTLHKLQLLQETHVK